MPHPLLQTLTACCIFTEAYRTVLTIWVWPWVREDLRGLVDLLELFEFLKLYLLPLIQLWAIWIHWQIFHMSFRTPWYATFPQLHAKQTIDNCLFPASQIILLSTCSGVLVQAPLNVSILILQRSSSDLETSHRHSWSDLSQLNTLISCFHKYVVPYFDAILDILKCDDSASKFGFVCDSFAWREYVLQYLDDSKSQFRCKAFEDQMWIGFTDGPSSTIWDIMAKDYIVEREGDCGTVWKMRKGQSCRDTSMFMEKNYV
jgi:hypothetical protein